MFFRGVYLFCHAKNFLKKHCQDFVLVIYTIVETMFKHFSIFLSEMKLLRAFKNSPACLWH